MAPLQERYRIAGDPARRSPEEPDDQRRGGGRRGKGEGPSARAGRGRALPERHGPARQGALLRRPCLGVRGRRSAGVEHGGGRLPGDLRHRHDGVHHEHPGDAPRRPRRLLPARVREARGVRERRAHRRQQPGRRAVDRLRRVRGRLLHLLRRRHDRPAVLLRVAPDAHLRDGRHPLGIADPGAPDRAGGDRGHGGRAGRHPAAGRARPRWRCRPRSSRRPCAWSCPRSCPRSSPG